MGACPSCGGENAEQARFCSSCGARLTPAGAEVRKTVTVLFCDVVGSTALGEATDPEVLRALLARYFDRMKAIVERHGGTVEKFIGDAVMAVFGLPVAHEDDALRAIHAAVEMRAALPALGIDARMGITTGEVVAGTSERLATGDAVNVAARLEQAAGAGEILASEATLRLAGAAVDAEPVPPLELKGKAQPVKASRVVSVSAIPMERAPSSSPLVGRTGEMASLRTAWSHARDGARCEAVTVVGAAGVGKSRLVAEFVAATEGLSVRARCLPYGDGITYWPVVGLVKRLDAFRATLDPTTAGALDVLLGAPGTTSADDIVLGVRRLLEAAAADGPVIVVLDDIQWGEDPFLDLIEHVALTAAGPILLLCLARPELLERRPDWPGLLRLEPLSGADAEELLDTRLGDTAVGAGLRERILATAGGNPLFVEEMASVLETAADPAEVAVPPTIQALLAARLDQLDAAERTVLEHGAIEGEVFHRGAVQQLTPAETRLLARLTALVRRQLVRPEQPSLSADDAYRFRHLLVRDAAYESIPKARRAQLHEQLASWLEAVAPDLVELDEIAGYHFEQAHRYEAELGVETGDAAPRAAEHLARAGRRALARGDVGAAVKLLTRAYDLTADAAADVDLMLGLTDALFFAGRLDEGADLTARTVAATRDRGDRVGELLATIQLAAFGFWQGRAPSEAVFAACDEAIPVFEALGDDRALMRAWGERGGAAAPRSLADAITAYERALEYGERAGDQHYYVRTLEVLLSGTYSMGATPFARILERLRGVTNPSVVRQRAVAEAGLGNIAVARSMLEDAHRRAEDLGDRYAVGATSTGRATVESLAGDFDAELRWQRRACDEFARMEHNSWLPSAAGRLSLMLARSGQLEEAEEWAGRAEREAGADDVDAQQIWRLAGALLLARAGEPDAAVGLADEALAMVRETDVTNMLAESLRWYGEILAAAGRDPEPAIREAMSLAEARGNVSRVARLQERLAALTTART